MKYISIKEASLLWDIDISRIGKLMRAGKIPGTEKIGGHSLKDTGIGARVGKTVSNTIDGDVGATETGKVTAIQMR